MLAVAFGIGPANAQETDKPKDQPLPWWKLSDEPAAKDMPAPDAQVPESKKADADENAPPRRDARVPVLRRPQDFPQTDRPVPPGMDVPGRQLPRPAGAEGPKPRPRERLVYRLANMPATDVARTVNELLHSEQPPSPSGGNMVVLADPVSNSLILSGTPDGIHETVKLIEQLDAEPLMVCVQVVIGLVQSREGLSLLAPNPEGPELSCSHAEACELIEQFSKSDAVKILARPQVMTLDNQPAFIQIGHRVPRVTGAKDGSITATTLDNVGLIVGVTPRITPDRAVTMEIDIEKSELGPADQGVPLGVDAKGNVIRSPKIETMMAQTTVRIPASRAVIVGGLALQDGDKRGELVLVVTPHVVARDK
jgi:hypothetical protein